MVSTVKSPEEELRVIEYPEEELRAAVTWGMRRLLISDERIARNVFTQIPEAHAPQELQQLLLWYSWNPDSGLPEPKVPASPGCVALFEQAWSELDDELLAKTPENEQVVFEQLFGPLYADMTYGKID